MTLAIAQKHQPLALCSKENARFGAWRFLLPPRPIKSPLFYGALPAKREEVIMHGLVKGVVLGDRR
ncbi:hypothetical protein NC652_035075 [Populus alba x Populus x berolinensis]|nr:hypothetical protein NC652_035075 [Populus alba x Populus x berolinensis]